MLSFDEREKMSLLSKRQMCEILQVSVRTLDYWRSNYGLPTMKLGQVCRFDEKEVMEWFQQYKERGRQ